MMWWLFSELCMDWGFFQGPFSLHWCVTLVWTGVALWVLLQLEVEPHYRTEFGAISMLPCFSLITENCLYFLLLLPWALQCTIWTDIELIQFAVPPAWVKVVEWRELHWVPRGSGSFLWRSLHKLGQFSVSKKQLKCDLICVVSPKKPHNIVRDLLIWWLEAEQESGSGSQTQRIPIRTGTQIFSQLHKLPKEKKKLFSLHLVMLYIQSGCLYRNYGSAKFELFGSGHEEVGEIL